MKIIIKLKGFQYTTEVDNISINCANGDIVINETTQLEAEKTEEPVHAVNQPEPAYEPSQGYNTSFIMILNLIKAGYSMEKIGEYTGIPGWKIRRINRGEEAWCKYYEDEGICKFPIREMPKIGSRCPGDKIPVTFCKECGELIPVRELLIDPKRHYCDKCATKHIPTMSYTDASSIISRRKPYHHLTHQKKGEVIKLLKLGYSIKQTAINLGLNTCVISKINQGRDSLQQEFPDVTFPIQHNKRELHWDAWRKIPVTYCKECGEPIPVADLVKDPCCECCPDCRAKPKEE